MHVRNDTIKCISLALKILLIKFFELKIDLYVLFMETNLKIIEIDSLSSLVSI